MERMSRDKIIELSNGVLFSERLTMGLERHMEELLQKILINKKGVASHINTIRSIANKPFLDYRKEVMCNILGVGELNDYFMFDAEIVKNLKVGSGELLLEFIESCEIYWDFKNALTFSCDLSRNKFNTDKLDKNKMKNLLTSIDELGLECIVVNFISNFYPCVLRLSKSNFKLGLKRFGETYDTYCITVSVADDMKIDRKGIDFFLNGKSISFYLVPELYSKIFVDNKYLSMRKKVSDFGYEFISKVDDTLRPVECIMQPIEGESKGYDSDAFNLIPYGVRNRDNTISEYTGLHFEEMLQMCFCCLDRYINRKKVYKKGKEQDDGVSVKMRVPSDKNPNEVLSRGVNLSDIVIYERKHRVNLGGHHASPREHIRRGYWRHYKSGKTVWIESTTVNKGVKKKTYYKV